MTNLEIKKSNSLHFKPFKPLAHYAAVLDQIEDLVISGNFEAAKKEAENLRKLALEGLNYFQTYDWLMLMTVITLGYVGWMLYLIVHVLRSYTLLATKSLKKEQSVHSRSKLGKVMYILAYPLKSSSFFPFIISAYPICTFITLW